jgi:hypothetical protein
MDDRLEIEGRQNVTKIRPMEGGRGTGREGKKKKESEREE